MSVPGTRRPRTSRTGVRVLSALAALMLAAGAHATTYARLTPGQMLDKADIVFVGTVSNVSVSVRGGRPWTDVSFDVETPIEGVPVNAAGKPSGPERLSFLGGDAVGGPSLTVSGMPQFQSGDRVLVFAYDQAYASPIVGFRQGLWHVTAAGLVDEEGRQLSVDANGALVAGGSGAPLQQIVDAVRKLLGPKATAP